LQALSVQCPPPLGPYSVEDILNSTKDEIYLPAKGSINLKLVPVEEGEPTRDLAHNLPEVKSTSISSEEVGGSALSDNILSEGKVRQMQMEY